MFIYPPTITIHIRCRAHITITTADNGFLNNDNKNCFKFCWGRAFCVKGIVSRDGYFFEGPENDICTLFMGADGFQNILWHTVEILLASMKLLSNYKIPSRYPIQRLRSGDLTLRVKTLTGTRLRF